MLLVRTASGINSGNSIAIVVHSGAVVAQSTARVDSGVLVVAVLPTPGGATQLIQSAGEVVIVPIQEGQVLVKHAFDVARNVEQVTGRQMGQRASAQGPGTANTHDGIGDDIMAMALD